MSPRTVKREDIMSADISFDLNRLFDPYNFDHIPKDDRLALFKQRDLPHIKHYKAAVKIFGGPAMRTRAIVAPPMETPIKHRLGLYMNATERPLPPVLNGPLKPVPEPVKELSKEEKENLSNTEKTSGYKSWVQQRQALRNNLNGLALNEAMLARKPNKTELETRVAAKFKADREWKPETPPPREKTPSPKPAPDIPVMNVPPPDGLQILDKFLSLNRMRLIDLFRITDKDKSWSLSREEFLNAVSQSAIPISEGEVDDMFIALDGDLDEELNFQELNKGLLAWRKQRRGLKKSSLGGDSQNTAGMDSSVESVAHGKSGSIQESKSSKPGSKGHTDKQSVQDGKSAKSSSNDHSDTQDSQVVLRDVSGNRSPKTFLGKDNTSSDNLHENLKESEKSEENISHHKEKSYGRNLKEREASQDSLYREKTSSSIEIKLKSREKSNVSSSKFGTSDEFVRKSPAPETQTPRAIIHDPARPSSGQKVTIVDAPTPSEGSRHNDHRTDKHADTSLDEDALNSSTESPKRDGSLRESYENGEYRVDSKAHTSTDRSTKQGSRKIGTPCSDTRSRTSTPNSLEPPEFDTTRTESRAPESAEAMLDIRKHDRVVLSRNSIRRSLSRDKKVTFDEVPGSIKVGYKAIDDHCADSTLGGDAALNVEQFRREKLREYFEVKKLFEEKGIPMNTKTLDRVLLYPGDRTVHVLKKNITLPLGPLTDDHSPFNQPKPKKKPPKRRRAFASRVAKTMGPGAGNINSLSTGAGDDNDGSGSASSKRSLITVEDVYPFAKTVTPKVYKENLSSGRALISRKVDNWMTFEEYSRYTEHLPNRFQHFNRPSNPDAVWSGYLLDKIRLAMPPHIETTDGKGDAIKNRDSRAYEGLGTGMYNGVGNAVFRTTAQQKLAYPGYNNDLLTWPVGPNGVRYGNIDEHRIIK